MPCWLSEYDGELYYLRIQTDVSAEVQPPMLGHQVLVEGVVADGAAHLRRHRARAGALSVMPERDANCNTLLPAEDRYTIDFNPRPPGPSGGRLAFAPDPARRRRRRGPKARRPSRSILTSTGACRSAIPADLVTVLQRARQIGAKARRVTGVRGAHRLSNGTLLEESPAIGQRRAEEVARLLAGAGLNVPLATDWRDGRVEADGIDDWRSRRVTVVLEP